MLTLGNPIQEVELSKRTVTLDEACSIGDSLGVVWSEVSQEEFRRGLEVEFEHGSHDPETNVTNDDPSITGKIAWAHLKEISDYYTRLDAMEAEAESSV